MMSKKPPPSKKPASPDTGSFEIDTDNVELDYITRLRNAETGEVVFIKSSEPRREKLEPEPARKPEPERRSLRRRIQPIVTDWRNVVLALFVFTFIWDHMPSFDRISDSDAIKAGKEWRQPLCDAFHDGFIAAADAMHSGKNVGEADIVLKNVAEKSRQDSFYRICAPVLSAIIPEPDPMATKPPPPPTPEQLKQFEQAMRDIGIGVGEKPGLFGR